MTNHEKGACEDVDTILMQWNQKKKNTGNHKEKEVII